jgi:hypothetical protein
VVQKEDEMKDEPTPLYIQDVIELLTNIKLKHGNLPIYKHTGIMLIQSNDDGVQHKNTNHEDDLPERVEIT